MEAFTDAGCDAVAPESSFLASGSSDGATTTTGAVVDGDSLVLRADSAIPVDWTLGSWIIEALAARIFARALRP